MMDILDALPAYTPPQEEEQWPGLNPDTARGLSSAISYAKALGLNPVVTETVRPDGEVPSGGSSNSNHYAKNGARAADLAWEGLQWGDSNFNGIADYLEQSGYSVIRDPHGTGPHIHFESQDRNPIDKFLFPTAEASPAKVDILDALPPAKQNNPSADILDALPPANNGDFSVFTPERINEAMRNFNLAMAPMNMASAVGNQLDREANGHDPMNDQAYGQPAQAPTQPPAKQSTSFIDNAAQMAKSYWGTLTESNPLDGAKYIADSDMGPGYITKDGQFITADAVDKRNSQYMQNALGPVAFPLAMIPNPLQRYAAPIAGGVVVDSLRQAFNGTNDKGQEEGMWGVAKALVSPVTGLYDKFIGNPDKFKQDLDTAPAETLFNTALELGVVALAGHGVYKWNKGRNATGEPNTPDYQPSETGPVTRQYTAEDLTPASRQELIDAIKVQLEKVAQQKWDKAETTPPEIQTQSVRELTPEQQWWYDNAEGTPSPRSDVMKSEIAPPPLPRRNAPAAEIFPQEIKPAEIIDPTQTAPGSIVMPESYVDSSPRSKTTIMPEYPPSAETVFARNRTGADPLPPTTIFRGKFVNGETGRLYDATSMLEKVKGLPLSRVVSDTWDGIRKYTAPATGEVGQYTQGLLKEVYSKQAGLMHDFTTITENGANALEKLGERSKKDYWDSSEAGTSHPSNNPDIIKAQQALRDFSDDISTRMVEEGHIPYSDLQGNYVSHVGAWENTPANQAIMGQHGVRTPGVPSSPFLEERVFVSHKQGRAAGMKMSDANPIKLQVDNLMQQWRFLETNKVAREMIDMGAMKRIGNDDVLLNKAMGQAKKAFENYKGEDKAAKQDALAMSILDGLKKKSEKAGYDTSIPADWIPISDRIGKTGWYAPKDLANTFNNALSQGLSGTPFKGIADVVRSTGNGLNAMQLSASAFHAGFTTVDAVVSQFALGEMKVAEGLKTRNIGMIGSGVKDIAMSGIPGVNLVSSALNLRQGAKFRSEALKKGTPERQALETGGGRLGQDDWYHLGVGEKMVQAFRNQNYLGAALRLPLAVVEALPKFIMEEVVPRQKLGVYSRMVEYEMMKNPKLMENPELARKTLQKAWDSVENRMGQVAYDNLFWHKYFKDIAMLTTRSVGWNLGTIREIGGGLTDVAKGVGNKGNVESGYRMSYLTALPAVVGFTGALYQYLSTGKGPEELKDYFFPKNGYLDKNGAAQRVSLPSYIKDIYHYANDPAKTVTNKAHPLIGMVADMLNNKDFYGTEIRHKGDPITKQVMDAGKFTLSQVLPFTVRGMSQQKDQPLSMKAQNFIGITPAPASINNTKAEQLASEINARKMGGTQTQEQFNESQSQQRIANAFRSKNPDLNNIIKEEMSKGLITQKQLNNVFQSFGQNHLQRQIKNMAFPDAIDVLSAASDEEKKWLKPAMVQKINNWLQNASPEEIKAYIPKFQQAMKNK